MHYIYVIRNQVNDRVYVGQTTKFAQRKAGHLYSARKGDHRPLYCAMRDLGVEKFMFEVLEECADPHVASQREAYWVAYFDSFKSGYNLTHGGGFHVGNRGRKFTEEHKRKISEAHKGKVFSDETCKKLVMPNVENNVVLVLTKPKQKSVKQIMVGSWTLRYVKDSKVADRSVTFTRGASKNR